MAAQALTVPFHGSNLFIVEYNGQPYTPMKPIVEGMGLAWQTQYRKLVAGDGQNDHTPKRWGIIKMVIPTLGDMQEAICLPLRKLAGWLMTIHPNKVRPEIREKIVMYQNECDDALWDYWTKGQAARQAESSSDPRPAGRTRILLTLENGLVVDSRTLSPNEVVMTGPMLRELWQQLVEEYARALGRMVSFSELPELVLAAGRRAAAESQK